MQPKEHSSVVSFTIWIKWSIFHRGQGLVADRLFLGDLSGKQWPYGSAISVEGYFLLAAVLKPRIGSALADTAGNKRWSVNQNGAKAPEGLVQAHFGLVPWKEYSQAEKISFCSGSQAHNDSQSAGSGPDPFHSWPELNTKVETATECSRSCHLHFDFCTS